MGHMHANLQTLVLNADMQPLSWGPLSVWPWQDALVAVLQDRVLQVSTYDVEVRSVSEIFAVPSVVALKHYHKRKRVSFTRYHVFLRDRFCCQYCGQPFSPKELTFDHIVPRSKGGMTTWTNIVTSCSQHNLQKGSRSLRESGLSLIRRPFEPSPFELDEIARQQTEMKTLHKTWLDYLYWDTALEE